MALSRKRGHIFIISAPSGAGKTTLVQAVLNRFSDMLYSVSYTTRAPRSGETNGIDYFFISEDDFIKSIENHKWAEWAKVHDCYYGTSADYLDKGRSAGHDILLDIDIQGMLQLLERYPDSITIFIMPPSLDTLRKRLESRGTDHRAAIEKRLANAEKEMTQKDLYRHIVVNDQLHRAVAELTSIIKTYRAP
jgi:guanylate kinase